jgi:hypothetical protein
MARFDELWSVSHTLTVINYEGAFLAPRCVAIKPGRYYRRCSWIKESDISCCPLVAG